MPVSTHGDQLLRVKVRQGDDIGSFDKARITERHRTMSTDDVNATMTQTDRFKVQRHAARLCKDHQLTVLDGNSMLQEAQAIQCFHHVRYKRTSNGLFHQGNERLVIESVPKANREIRP